MFLWLQRKTSLRIELQFRVWGGSSPVYALVKLPGCSYTANKTPTFVRRAYRAKRELNKTKCVQIYRHIYYVIVCLVVYFFA